MASCLPESRVDVEIWSDGWCNVANIDRFFGGLILVMAIEDGHFIPRYEVLDEVSRHFVTELYL